MKKASGFEPVSPEPEKMTDSCLHKLSSDLASLLMEEEDSDMTLVSNTGDHLPVHALLLKARSTYFRTLLSTRWEVGKEVMMEVGKEALTMIVTFLYTGKLDKEEVAVEILFEVLQNARMMQITDLEEEVKTHIISNLVGGSKLTDAAQVFNILNLGLENKFPEVVKPCLAFCQTILNDERMISKLEEGDILMLSPSSMAAIFSTLDPSSVAFIISLGLRNDFWKGREDKVFRQLGPEIKDEALQMLEVEDLMRIFKHSASEDLGSRVARVVVDTNDKLEEKTSMLESQVKQNWGVGWMKIHNMQKENKELKKIDTGKNQQIRELEISWHHLKQIDMGKNDQIQDLEQTCDLLKSMDNAKHRKIKKLEKHIARLERLVFPTHELPVQGIVLPQKKILRQIISSPLSHQKQFFLACFSFLVFLFINSIL